MDKTFGTRSKRNGCAVKYVQFPYNKFHLTDFLIVAIRNFFSRNFLYISGKSLKRYDNIFGMIKKENETEYR